MCSTRLEDINLVELCWMTEIDLYLLQSHPRHVTAMRAEVVFIAIKTEVNWTTQNTKKDAFSMNSEREKLWMT